MNWQMKTTVEISEELYRRAEAQAALEGRKLKDLIEEGLRLVINPRRERRQPASLAALTRTARGVVNSGIPDLASNPKHLAGFGRDVRRHR
jgi:predicted component of type VI protein secretion system